MKIKMYYQCSLCKAEAAREIESPDGGDPRSKFYCPSLYGTVHECNPLAMPDGVQRLASEEPGQRYGYWTPIGHKVLEGE